MSAELLDDITLDPSGDIFCVLAENASIVKAESLAPFLQEIFDRVKASTGFCDADVLRAIALLPQYSSVADLTEAADSMLMAWISANSH